MCFFWHVNNNEQMTWLDFLNGRLAKERIPGEQPMIRTADCWTADR